MTLSRSKSLARWTGFLVGFAAAIAIVVLGRVEAHEGVPAARLTMATKPTDALLTEPAGVKFFSSGELRPGRPARGASGDLVVTNLTQRRMSVALRARPSTDDLDRVVRIEMQAASKPLFDGLLEELRSGHRFVLEGTQRKRLEVRAWIPASVEEGYHGREVDVDLLWGTRKAGS